MPNTLGVKGVYFTSTTTTGKEKGVENERKVHRTTPYSVVEHLTRSGGPLYTNAFISRNHMHSEGTHFLKSQPSAETDH